MLTNLRALMAAPSLRLLRIHKMCSLSRQQIDELTVLGKVPPEAILALLTPAKV